MIKKWYLTIPELTGDQKRRAYVYVPDDFKKNPDLRYPVLYMFDGHNVFYDRDATYGKSWGMKEYLRKTKTPLIVAAVECNHSPDHGRLSEYSPFTYSDPDFGHIRGRGRTTMDWFVHTFKPFIDQNFPTIPDREHTFIGGSSMGGLMSLYAILAYNKYFSGAAALSPSLWTHPENIEKLIRSTRVRPNTRLYMDYGSRELQNHPGMKKQFQRVTSLLLAKNIFLNARIVPNGEHCEACWEKQIPFFMNTLLYN